MADNTKEVVKVLNSIVKSIDLLNRNVRAVAKALEQKQFDDWFPPELGTAVQNTKGCVMLNASDFDRLFKDGEEE